MCCSLSNRVSKKIRPAFCRICLFPKKLSCLHLCYECKYVLKKYYRYEDCPYCLDIFEPRITSTIQLSIEEQH